MARNVVVRKELLKKDITFIFLICKFASENVGNPVLPPGEWKI
jgi:hypothetical protein